MKFWEQPLSTAVDLVLRRSFPRFTCPRTSMQVIAPRWIRDGVAERIKRQSNFLVMQQASEPLYVTAALSTLLQEHGTTFSHSFRQGVLYISIISFL